MRHFTSGFVIFTSLVLLSAVAYADEPKPPEQPAEAPKIELNEREKQFERTLSGATMIGRSSTHGKEDKPPVEDRYVISKVTKIGQDLWLFTVRIGQSKVPVPLPIPVKWAGDTAVITVDSVKVPGMGTFSARVLVHAEHYAGTWDAGDHGGHLWGRIERKNDEGKI